MFEDDISLQLSRSHEVKVTLAQNKLEVADNPFDPYATIQREWNFFTIEETSLFTKAKAQDDLLPGMNLRIMLSNSLYTHHR